MPVRLEQMAADTQDKGPKPHSPVEEKGLPPLNKYLWSSVLTAHEEGETRFSGFEPCYIACIKDLEGQIKAKIQTIDLSKDNAGLTAELSPLLLQYSELIDALSNIESKDRVFEEDALINKDDMQVRYAGMRRRVARDNDRDRVHDHLRQNIFLVVFGYIYNWDMADRLKKRFGNLTQTLDRVLVGVTGGASLLIPMIMMTFLTGRNARLLIVSIATILFAMAMALWSKDRESVIGATSAYAAIMVVYIGSSETTAG